MSNIKDFQVNYRLNVQAADAVAQLKSFTSAVSGLASVDNALTKTASNLKTMSSSLKSVFGANGNKKYSLKIDTKSAEANIDRVISKLSTLESKLKNMSMGAGAAGSKMSSSTAQRNMSAYSRMPSRAASQPYSRNDIVPFMRGRYSSSSPKGIGGWGYPSGYQPKTSQYSWKSAGTYANYTPYSSGGGANPPVSGGRNRNAGGRRNPARDAAINRLHYSNIPSWRNLPFANMLGSYFMYGAVKNELADAIEFTHTVSAAKEVLTKTDSDLSTFSDRFRSMMAHVRQIGVDTRFTMVDMAKATQFMAQAGFSTEEIQQSIKPISNLALIADAPIQDIADNITGVLSGYRINTNSTRALSDQMAATYTRSKTTIQEMSEAFKMSAGFLQMAGVDVSEAIAAFGVLGNANLRGTMAGTSVRSMMTFLAKPSKGAKQTLSKLGVSITENVEVFGETVRKLRPLADIFQDLKQAGASLQDMSSIFGKIGGTGAMVLASRSDELRALTNVNLSSHGMAEHLGKKKQETTSGLWEQVTSQWSESFTQVFESLEPRIHKTLQKLTEMLSSTGFTDGLRSLGESMLTVFDIASKIGAFVVSQWSWIEPLLISGATAKAAMSLLGFFSNLYTIFKSAAAIEATTKIASGVGSIASGMSEVVKTGGGLSGAIASVGSLGAKWLFAAGGISAFLGVLAVAGIDFYKFEQKKSAFLEEGRKIDEYHFPSLEAMKQSFLEITKAAKEAAHAKDKVLEGQTVKDKFPNAVGETSWLNRQINSFVGYAGGMGLRTSGTTAQIRQQIKEKRDKALVLYKNKDMVGADKLFKEARAMEGDLNLALSGGASSNYNLDISAAAKMQANIDREQQLESAYAIIANTNSAEGANEAVKQLQHNLQNPATKVDESLHYYGLNGTYGYKAGLNEKPVTVLRNTKAYHDQSALNASDSGTYVAVKAVAEAMGSSEKARNLIFGEDVPHISKLVSAAGFTLSNGKWTQSKLGKQSSDQERTLRHIAVQEVSDYLYELQSRYTGVFKGHGELTSKLLAKTGLIPDELLKNSTYEKNKIEAGANFSNEDYGQGGASSGDLSSAGGNYSGAGKMNSVVPKQVNVTIENLMSIDTIKLMGTEEGKSSEIQDLKGTLTQLLLEVVHDFDSSWNG